MKAVSLSRRQEQVAGLVSCGLAKKEIANELHIAESTVDNTLRAVYEKTGFGKINELTCWWISKRYHITIDLRELKNQIIAMSLLALVIFQTINNQDGVLRARRVRRIKRNETEIITEQ